MGKKLIKKWLLTISCTALVVISCAACGEQLPNYSEIESHTDLSENENTEITGTSVNNYDSESENETSGENDSESQEPLKLTACDQTVTLMVYMIGSDLESKSGAATNDLAEMAESGVDTDRVHLIVYTGGCTQWQNGIPSDENSVFELSEYGFSQVDSWGQESMGEAENLSRFLNYVYENYPADSYDLILWDHGNGPLIGYGIDTQYNRDSLTLSEMKEALEASPFDSNNKLGFVGFDACLMSSAELVCTFSDYADYIIASQEVEPNFGWNYSFLSKCGYVDNCSLARLAVIDYLDGCESYFAEHENFSSDVTMACIDLSHADNLKSAINTLFAKAIDDVSGDYNILARERVNTRALGRATTGSEYDLVDVNDLMECMSDTYPQETDAVQTILKDMIIQFESNTDGCCGMSIYYPYYNKDYYNNSWKNQYEEIGLFPDYITYLERYEQIWLGTDMQDYFSEPLTAEEYQPGSFSLQLSDEQTDCYASGSYYILERTGEGIYRQIAHSSKVNMENGKITADFDGRSLVVSNDYGESHRITGYLTDSRDGMDYYSLFHKVISDYETEIVGIYELQLAVNTSTYETTVEGIYYLGDVQSDSFMTGKKEPLDLDEWGIINFEIDTSKYPTRNENGVLMPYDDWTEDGWILAYSLAVADGLNFTYEPFYDNGNEIYLMFQVNDVQGNSYSSELMPVTVAAAPVTAEEPEDIHELEWTGCSESPSFTESGVSVSMISTADILTGAPSYCILFTNTNDFDVYAEAGDILINDTFETIYGGSAYIDAHSSSSVTVPNIQKYISLSGIDEPESFTFTFTIRKQIDNSHVGRRQKVIYTLKNVTRELSYSDKYGIFAENQLLFENEDVSIVLSDCGVCEYQTNYDDLSCIVHMENNSDNTYTLKIWGADCAGTGVSTNISYKNITAFPHCIANSNLAFEDDILKFMEIDDVTEMRLYLTLENNETGEYILNDWIPIQINSGSNTSVTDFSAAGDTLYENDDIQIIDYGTVQYDKYCSEITYRRVLIINKTSNILQHTTIDPTDEQDNPYINDCFLTDNILLPGVAELMYYENDSSDEENGANKFPAIELKLKYEPVTDYSNVFVNCINICHFDGSEQETEIFTIPAYNGE